VNARENEQPRQRRRWWRRLASFLLWYLVPILVGIAALGYIYGALIWHVNPPVVAVEGTSMLPTLRTGDLVFLSPANPNTLKKGDIIAVHVPAQDRTTYALPANVVHRIVRVERSSGQLVFITKGDNNPGNDVFTTAPSNVVGRLRYVVPGVGFFFLFLQSRQGEIFFGAVAVIGLLYFVLGLFDDRRRHLQEAMISVQAVLAETQKLEQELATSQRTSLERSPPSPVDPAPAPDPHLDAAGLESTVPAPVDPAPAPAPDPHLDAAGPESIVPAPVNPPPAPAPAPAPEPEPEPAPGPPLDDKELVGGELIQEVEKPKNKKKNKKKKKKRRE